MQNRSEIVRKIEKTGARIRTQNRSPPPPTTERNRAALGAQGVMGGDLAYGGKPFETPLSNKNEGGKHGIFFEKWEVYVKSQKNMKIVMKLF